MSVYTNINTVIKGVVMKVFLFTLMFLMLITTSFSNNLHTVGNPTAGVLSSGEARIHTTMIKDNGMMIGADVGLFKNFQFGFTYGALEIVGDNTPKWKDFPDFRVRYRLLDETTVRPAWAIGVDTHGGGAFDGNHYDYKSKGIYSVVSKNFSFMGLMGVDFGINHTFEQEEKEQPWDLFTGFYKTIGDNITLLLDYSLGINSRNRELDYLGFLNAAVQAQISDQLSIRFKLHDLLMNRKDASNIHRSLMIDYRWFF